MQRYFASIDKNFDVCFSKDDEHHILHVMRMKSNDEIEVVDNGKVFLCRIDKTNPLTVVSEIVYIIGLNIRKGSIYAATLYFSPNKIANTSLNNIKDIPIKNIIIVIY